jgi:hypothetical protein
MRADYYVGILATLLISYLGLTRIQTPERIFVSLAQAAKRGLEAYLCHYASMGYISPKFRPAAVDLKMLYTQAEPVGEFTLEQLADHLDLPIAHIREVILQGQLEARQAGSRYQIEQSHLRAYKAAEIERRKAIVDEMTAEAQALGLYDL